MASGRERDSSARRRPIIDVRLLPPPEGIPATEAEWTTLIDRLIAEHEAQHNINATGDGDDERSDDDATAEASDSESSST